MQRSFNLQSIFGLSRLFSFRIGLLVLGVVYSILWARYVDPKVYGQYQLIISILSIAGGLCLPGLASSVMISAAKKFDGNFKKILLIKNSVTICCAFIICGVGYYYKSEQPQLFHPLLIAAFFFPFVQLTTIWTSWMNGRGMVGQLFFFQFFISLLGVIFLGGMLFLGFRSLNYLIIVEFMIGAISSIIFVYYIITKKENNNYDYASIKYGFHTSLAAIFATLIATDKILINHLSSSKDVAIYSVALIFPAQIRTLYSVINQLLIPNIYKAKSVREAWDYLKPKIGYLYLTFILIGIVGFFIFPIIIPWLFSENYIAAVPYGKWLWLSLAFSAPTTYLSGILNAQQKIFFLYFSSIFHPISLFILYLILIRYGITGVIVSRIITHWTTGFLFLIFFLFYLKSDQID